uniref:ATP synthase complex subunit 8 n=1 Tax=Colasposoma sp. EMHAU-15070314 TaxID=2480060 RepID=A0A3G3C752_9CUCU|nr:ATP synthase F0 subunit 8 [Colasposoma sp. EMHAU-15070314]
MPQMAPLNWLSMFIMFIMTLVMFILQNYFIKIDYPKKLNLKTNKNSYNWKW